jgi:AraC-like DNA-binding protein
MALTECNTTVGSDGRELLEHGTTAFPIACYEDDFRITDVPWHWHEEWEAVILTRGSCLVAAGSHKALLRAGEGFFVHSGALHGCWDEETSGCMFHSMVFHPRLIGGSLDSIFHQQFVHPLLESNGPELVVLKPDVPWQRQALEAIESAWQHCVRESNGFPFLVRSSLSELIYLLYSHLSPAVSSVRGRDIRNAQRIKAMLTCVHTNYGSELSIADIAQSASVSESECLRCFRDTIGTTPIQYLKQYRIQQAARLLTETHMKISDIATACGFQDMSYFTRAFRAQMGSVPTQYRKTAGL